MRASFLTAVSFVAFALAYGNGARADVAPSNLKGCEHLGAGAACLDDSCNPGTCQRTWCAEWPAGCCDPVLALLPDAQQAGCRKCTREDQVRVDCFACVPPGDRASQNTTTQRWDDCAGKKPSDVCRTKACDEGACTERAKGSDVDLVCEQRVVPRKLALVPYAAAASALLVAVVVLERRRRSAKRRTGPK